MKIGDLVENWNGVIGVIADTHKRTHIYSVWVIWSDGSEPLWLDDDEVMLYENR